MPNPALDPAQIQARVERGAALLDAKAPGWWIPRRLNLDRLLMQSCVDCTLGHVFGGYTTGLVALGFRFHQQGEAYGFDIEGGMPDEYAALTAVWRALIAGRREAQR